MLVGVWAADFSRVLPSGPLPLADAGTAALLLIFAYGGYEVTGIPAGEASNPRRDVPFAFVATILIVTTVMTLAAAVATGVLPDIAATRTPIADASAILMGAAGGLLVSVGTVLSMTGNNMGQLLSGSRSVYALAEHGDLPPVFARIHPVYRTPHVAIWFTTIVLVVLALTGSFVFLAAVSAVARLVIYLSTCLATLWLRRPASGRRRRGGPGDLHGAARPGDPRGGLAHHARHPRRRDDAAAAGRPGRACRRGAVVRSRPRRRVGPQPGLIPLISARVRTCRPSGRPSADRPRPSAAGRSAAR